MSSTHSISSFLPVVYALIAAASESEPVHDRYLVATHQEMLLKLTVEPIAASRRVCAELKADLQERRSVELIVSPVDRTARKRRGR